MFNYKWSTFGKLIKTMYNGDTVKQKEPFSLSIGVPTDSSVASTTKLLTWSPEEIWPMSSAPFVWLPTLLPLPRL